MKAIDVSCWNTGIDYKAVKAYGIDTVIIRAGYGREVSQKDTQFETHYRNARAAGLNIGAYWYSYADSAADAVAEAKTCLSCISGKTFELPIYFDMEESWQTSLGRSALTNMAISFNNTIEAAGYRGGVYSNVNWFSNYLNYSTLASKYSIWLAQWGTSTYSYGCDIWQYSESGRVSGVSGNVDVNIVVNPDVINGGAKGGTCELTFDILAKTGYTSSGEQVKTVQRILNSLGYKDADKKALDIDGQFGGRTEYAVKLFQKDKGLTVDGIVGQRTWSKLTGGR